MAAIIQRELGVAATLTPGNRGEFTVWLDGTLLLDKSRTGEFPDEDAVLAAIRPG